MRTTFNEEISMVVNKNHFDRMWKLLDQFYDVDPENDPPYQMTDLQNAWEDLKHSMKPETKHYYGRQRETGRNPVRGDKIDS